MKLMKELNLLVVLVFFLTTETRCFFFDNLANGIKGIFPSFKTNFDVSVGRLDNKTGDEQKNAIENSSTTEPSNTQKEKNRPDENNNASNDLNGGSDSEVKTNKPGKNENATKGLAFKLPINSTQVTDINFLNRFSDKGKKPIEYFKNFTQPKSTDEKDKPANKEKEASAEPKPQPNVPQEKSEKKKQSFFKGMLCKMWNRFCAEKNAS